MPDGHGGDRDRGGRRTGARRSGNAGITAARHGGVRRVFRERHGPGPVELTAYAGRSGQRYTADGIWQVDCNGQIRSLDTPTMAVGNCPNQTAVSFLNQLAYTLGVQGGAATPSANHAVTAYTDTRDPGTGTTEFQTADNIRSPPPPAAS